MMSRVLLASLTALGALLLVPSVAAHTTVATADGSYLVTVGNLGEPVTTHVKTGLDLLVRANQTGRPGITGAHLTLNATLIAPNGEELSQPLEGQFGKPGAYTFEDPYVLTVAGEYYLRLSGTINQTQADFDRILVGSGPIPAIEELGFPDDVDSPKQLQARIGALEARLASLEEDGAKSEAAADSPSIDPVIALLGVALVGFLVRRRRDA